MCSYFVYEYTFLPKMSLEVNSRSSKPLEPKYYQQHTGVPFVIFMLIGNANCLHIYSYEVDGTNTLTFWPLKSLEVNGGQAESTEGLPLT